MTKFYDERYLGWSTDDGESSDTDSEFDEPFLPTLDSLATVHTPEPLLINLNKKLGYNSHTLDTHAPKPIKHVPECKFELTILNKKEDVFDDVISCK